MEHWVYCLLDSAARGRLSAPIYQPSVARDAAGYSRAGPGALLVAVGDAAAVEVVGRELDLHPVAGQDADVVAAHLAGDVTEDLMVVVELDLEHRVGQGLGDLALHLDLFLFAHRRGGGGPAHRGGGGPGPP